MQLATADLETFKKGNKVTVAMVPAAAPDKQVTATFSLSGFTAGFEALQKTQ
jgi:invasion protein IalB